MFTVALFTTAKTWKQPKCPVTDEWIKNIYIYIYIQGWPKSSFGQSNIMEYYSAIKRKEMMPLAGTMKATRRYFTK